MLSHADLSTLMLHILFPSLIYFTTRYSMCLAFATGMPISSGSSSLLFGNPPNLTLAMSDEQRLFYTLMNGYERAVRPMKNSSQAIVVKLGITLTQIMDIVSRKTTSDYRLNYHWNRMNEIKS